MATDVFFTQPPSNVMICFEHRYLRGVFVHLRIATISRVSVSAARESQASRSIYRLRSYNCQMNSIELCLEHTTYVEVQTHLGYARPTGFCPYIISSDPMDPAAGASASGRTQQSQTSSAA
ncbi:hypothetical protein KIN20_034026 [Parelaphostrongylus tenuis]|uniref:Uncharacterized protein n=1 Tax=Parelaphostrongylus tenuis TaxID=148309 RepID=A0AAD5WIX9_PARTN|nr:hypothetical protein KIN20_034026 [Parelaphostrongylus tenuis]